MQILYYTFCMCLSAPRLQKEERHKETRNRESLGSRYLHLHHVQRFRLLQTKESNGHC